MDKREIGERGENLAKAYLQKLGWQVLETNWRFSRAEIDLILKDKEGLLVFVEVKTRSYNYFGEPEDFVSEAQQLRLMDAANRYMESIGYDWAIRFDIVSIILNENGSYQLKHLEDAFYP